MSWQWHRGKVGGRGATGVSFHHVQEGDFKIHGAGGFQFKIQVKELRLDNKIETNSTKHQGFQFSIWFSYPKNNEPSTNF